MISLTKRFLFIHIPKTGGNSVQNILQEYSDDKIVTPAEYQDGVERFELRSDEYDITKHSTLSQYKTVLKPVVYQRLFKFATVRNPWDRLISYYFSPHRGVTTWDRAAFLELLDGVPSVSHFTVARMMVDKVAARLGFAKLLGPRKALDADVDFVMSFETLQSGPYVGCWASRRLRFPKGTSRVVVTTQSTMMRS